MIHTFTKAVNDELQEIERLLQRGETAFRKAFAEYLKTIKSASMLKAIRKFLENSDIEGLINHINSSQKPFAKVFADLMLAAGTSEVATLKPKIQRRLNRVVPAGTPKPTVGIDFQIANERAAKILRSQTETLIREINETQRQTIYQVLSDAQLEGKTPRDTAKVLVDDIGLTAKQQKAVANYERLLREGNKEALSRDLRDRRFDASVRRMDEKPLTGEQIDRMVNAYRSRYERYRGNMIARTESHAAVNAARQEALQQSIEQSGIDPTTVTREWRATRDPRTRDTHEPASGQKVGLNEPFVIGGAQLMTPGDRSLGAPASEVVNCRCTTIVQFAD